MYRGKPRIGEVKRKKEAEENRKDINRTRSGGKSENAGKRERDPKEK